MCSQGSANATIRIPGTAIDLRVEARRQGSTYVLDNSGAAGRGGEPRAGPRLVQLDAWQESSHPYFWSHNARAAVEAEMFRGFLRGGRLHSAVRTSTPAAARPARNPPPALYSAHS